jgi:hypothetical protein
MMNGNLYRCLLLGLAASFALAGPHAARAQQSGDGTDLSIELVDPKVLRVCADPRNLPFSNEKGEGLRTRSPSCLPRNCRRNSTTCISRRLWASSA